MAYLRGRVRWDASGAADPGDRLQGAAKIIITIKNNNFLRSADLKLFIEAQESCSMNECGF
jgi:hypothetical protein